MSRGRHAWEVAVGGTLRDVFMTLERGGMRIAVATDDAGRIAGVMTDGDARRAMLGGAPLESPLLPLLNRKFTSVQRMVSRVEVLELMHARHLDSIPVVDGDGVLLGLHQLHDVLGVAKRPNWAVVMAGGRGTRLGSLTQQIPKPMIRVAGRPILERLLLHLVGYGIQRVFLSINYLGHVIEEYFGDGARFGCTIEYLREERPLGTAGALALLPEPPTHPLFVMNGDLVTQANVGSMIDVHRAGRQTITVGVRPYFHTVPFGCVEMEGSRVVRFEEKPRVGRLVNAGIYVVSGAVLAHIPKGQECTMPMLIEGCLERGETVSGVEIDEDWIDVGHRDQLNQARGDDL